MSYRAFPIKVFPDEISEYITLQAETLQVDHSYIALPLLSVCAAAIGNSRSIKINSEWSEPAMIWTCIVGDSSTGKTPAISKAVCFSRKREDQAAEEYKQLFETYKQDLTKWKKSDEKDTPPTEPTRNRFVVDDVTIEVVAEMLQRNPRGLLLANDELAGWFSSFGLYRQGRGSIGDVAKWCSIWSRYPLSVDRKTATSKSIYVPRPNISICGSIQPSTLKLVLEQQYQKSGLSARILFAYPDKQPRDYVEPRLPKEIAEAVSEAIEWLYNLNGEMEIEMEADAKEAFIAYVRVINKRAQEADEEEAAALGKIKAYAARFSLVLHLLERALHPGGAPVRAIQRHTVINAVTLAGWFLTELKRVTEMLTESEESELKRKILKKISDKGPLRVKDFVAYFHRYFPGGADEIRSYLSDRIEEGSIVFKDERYHLPSAQQAS